MRITVDAADLAAAIAEAYRECPDGATETISVRAYIEDPDDTGCESGMSEECESDPMILSDKEFRTLLRFLIWAFGGVVTVGGLLLSIPHICLILCIETLYDVYGLLRLLVMASAGLLLAGIGMLIRHLADPDGTRFAEYDYAQLDG